MVTASAQRSVVLLGVFAGKKDSGAIYKSVPQSSSSGSERAWSVVSPKSPR